MKLYEFQGKEIFKKYGIPIQSGFLIRKSDEVKNLTPPLVLKSQVLVGGRGKVGGIKIWDGKTTASQVLGELFSLKIKGEKVSSSIGLRKSGYLKRNLYFHHLQPGQINSGHYCRDIRRYGYRKKCPIRQR